MLPGTAESYWMDSTPSTAYPPLAGDLFGGHGRDRRRHRRPVHRLGAGADRADRGVLEADRIAASVSGYTTAKLSSLHTLIYAKIRRSFGPSRSATRAVPAAGRRRVEEGKARHRLRARHYPVSPTRQSPELVDQVRAEVDAANEAGPCRPRSYHRDQRLPSSRWQGPSGRGPSAVPSPQVPAPGLPRIISRSGSQIFEQPGRPDFLRVDTVPARAEQGDLTARSVMGGTPAPSSTAHCCSPGSKAAPPGLVIAAVMAALTVTRTGCSSPGAEHPLRADQPVPETGGSFFITGRRTSRRGRLVSRRWERLLTWTGPSPVPDHLPVGDAGQRTVDQIRSSGRSIEGAKNTVAAGFGPDGDEQRGDGRPAAGRVDLRQGWRGPRCTTRRLLRPARPRPMIKLQAKAARHLIGGRLRPSTSTPLDDVGHKDGGGPQDSPGNRRAVYRDDSGVLHGVSARCAPGTCIVRYNDAERAWECPCRGSASTSTAQSSRTREQAARAGAPSWSEQPAGVADPLPRAAGSFFPLRLGAGRPRCPHPDLRAGRRKFSSTARLAAGNIR